MEITRSSNRCNEFKLIQFERGLLDNVIDAIYVILLKDSPRTESVYRQLYNLKLCKTNFIEVNQRFKKCHIPELHRQNTAYHLLYNNIQIIKHANQHNFNNILILEDDFIFTNDITNNKIINDLERFTTNTDFNLLLLGCIPYLSFPNFKSLKFPHIILSAQTHSTIFSRKGRNIVLDQYNRCSGKMCVIKNNTKQNIPLNQVELHDLWFNYFMNKKYCYYKPLCFQPNSETENRKLWDDKISSFQISLFKLDTEPIRGLKKIYIVLYILNIFCILLLLFLIVTVILYITTRAGA